MAPQPPREPSELRTALARMPPADRWVLEAPLPLWTDFAQLPRAESLVFDARNKRGFPSRLEGYSGAVAGVHVRLAWHGNERDLRLLAGIFSDGDEMPQWALESLSNVSGRPGTSEVPGLVLATAKNALANESRRIADHLREQALWAVQRQARSEQGNPTSRVDLQRPDNPLPELSAAVAALAAKEREILQQTLARRADRALEEALAVSRRALRDAQSALTEARSGEIERIEAIEKRLIEDAVRIEKTFKWAVVDGFAFNWSLA